MKPPCTHSLRFKEAIMRNMKGPCFGHERANFWQFEGQKGATGQASCSLGKGSALYLGPLTDKNTPCILPSGRKLEISVNIDARTLKLGMKPPCAQSLRFRKNQLGRPSMMQGPCLGHKRAKFWQFKGQKGDTGQGSIQPHRVMDILFYLPAL